MGAQLHPVRSFGRTSPVREYWLAHCQGFRLRTRRGRRGVVEAVGYDGSVFEPEVLAVRIGLRGKLRLIPADAVEEVVPAERLLVVTDSRAVRPLHGSPRPSHDAGRVRRLPPVAARTVRAGAGSLAGALRRLFLALASGSAVTARGAGRAARAGGATAADAMRCAALASATGLRRAKAGAEALARRGSARLAIGLPRAARRVRGRVSAARNLAAPRVRTGVARTIQALRAGERMFERPLLRVHARLARAGPRALSTSPDPARALGHARGGLGRRTALVSRRMRAVDEILQRPLLRLHQGLAGRGRPERRFESEAAGQQTSEGASSRAT